MKLKWKVYFAGFLGHIIPSPQTFEGDVLSEDTQNLEESPATDNDPNSNIVLDIDEAVEFDFFSIAEEHGFSLDSEATIIEIPLNSNLEPYMDGEGVVLEPLSDEIDNLDDLHIVSPLARTRRNAPSLQTNVDLDMLNEMGTVSADYLLEAPNPLSRNTPIAPRNTNPNIAINIPVNYFGQELLDLANNQQRWYNFNVAANRKVTVNLSYDSGVYDLVLFELVGSTLQPVADSFVGGGVERLSYKSQNGGTYFLAVAPYIPAPSPHLFTFVVNVTSNFDSYEGNDFPNQARRFSDTINLQANLDNSFDEDWYKLNITTAGTKDITVSNAPAGNNYAVVVYDNNLNSIGSFFANNSQTRAIDFNRGDYYIRIFSFTGHVVPANYSLSIVPYIPPRHNYGTKEHYFEFAGARNNGKFQVFPYGDILEAEPGGRLEFEVTVFEWDDYPRQRELIIIPEIRVRGEWGEIQYTRVRSGTHTFYMDLPYRTIHQVGQPIINLNAVRFQLAGADDRISGHIKVTSYGRLP